MPDLAPIRIGPLALAGDRALVALVLAAGLVVAEIVARRRGRDADWAWSSVVVGLLAARLAWVALHPASYLARPLEVVYVWQGGFSAWAGVVAGGAWAAAQTLRRDASIRALVAPAGAALAMAAAALLVMPVAPERPSLEAMGVSVERLDGADADGTAVDVATWRGRPTVVNLWATWCGPCRRELPMLIEVVGGRDDVRLALVSQAEAEATVRDYLAREELPGGDVWLDRAGALGRVVSLTGLPTTLFIDASGEVRQVAFGELSRARVAYELGRITSTDAVQEGPDAGARPGVPAPDAGSVGIASDRG